MCDSAPFFANPAFEFLIFHKRNYQKQYWNLVAFVLWFFHFNLIFVQSSFNCKVCLIDFKKKVLYELVP